MTLALAPATIAEGAASQVTASLNKATSADVTVTVSAAAQSTAAADDFTLSANRALTIAAGQTASTGTVRITALDDTTIEPDKHVSVSGSVTVEDSVLLSGEPTVRDPTSVVLTITNDDVPTVTLALSSTSISENGGESTVTATLSDLVSEDVELTVSATAISPASASDFALSGNKVLTITAGQTSSTGTVTITAEDSGVDALAKELTVSAAVTTGPTGLTAPASRTLTITDDEGAPEVTLALGPPSISEDGGESTVTATLSGTTSEDVTLTVSATAVSPASASDFALSGNRVLTITAGQTSSTGTVTITAEDNEVDAPAKKLTVSAAVTTGPTGVAAPASRTLTITDDEGAPEVTLALGPPSISEDGGRSTVTATLSGTTSKDVTLTVSATARTLTITDDEETPTVTLALDPTSIGENRGVSTVTASLNALSSADVVVTVSATAVDPAVASYFTLSGNRELTITAGQTESTGTVTVTAVNNGVDAPSKTVEVTASATGGNGVTAPAARTLTITDDEALPVLTWRSIRRPSARTAVSVR